MVLVLSGTKEGTEIISLLASKGIKLCAITATSYGSKLAGILEGVEVLRNPISKGKLSKLFQLKKFVAVVDASHSLPGPVSNLAREMCMAYDIPYIRFLREETELPENSLINVVFSWDSAAQKAAELGTTIFLTTGSNNLESFLENKCVKGKRVVVRVLPDYKVVQKCQSLGLTPKDIVAMQGPFSKEMNRQQFKMYNASVIVTKDSGQAGGTDTKISAAISLGIPVVMIKRQSPREKYEVTDYSELTLLLHKFCKNYY